MFCPNCGTNIPQSDDRFCPNCGITLPEIAPPIPQAAQSESNEKSRSVMLAVLITSAITIVVLVVIVGILLSTGGGGGNAGAGQQAANGGMGAEMMTTLPTEAPTTTTEATTTTTAEPTIVTSIVTIPQYVPIIPPTTRPTTAAPYVYKDSSYIIPDSNSRYLSQSEVESMSTNELIYAINEIYARKGYDFEDTDFASYFRAKSWYYPSIDPEDFSSSMFNEYEQYNVDLLKGERESRR